jgi:hypothetical protein
MFKATAALIQCGLVSESSFRSLRMAIYARVDAGVPSRQSQFSFGTGSVLLETRRSIRGGVFFQVSDWPLLPPARDVHYPSFVLRELVRFVTARTGYAVPLGDVWYSVRATSGLECLRRACHEMTLEIASFCTAFQSTLNAAERP